MDRITISWSRVSLAAGLGAVWLVVALLAGSQSETLAAHGNFIGYCLGLGYHDPAETTSPKGV